MAYLNRKCNPGIKSIPFFNSTTYLGRGIKTKIKGLHIKYIEIQIANKIKLATSCATCGTPTKDAIFKSR